MKASTRALRQLFLPILVIACLAQNARGQSHSAENPYSPAYGHSYRHGAVPTQDAWRKMRSWASQHHATSEASPNTSSNTLAFGGGIDGTGVTSGTPKVYLVFYGIQWKTGGDPNGAAVYLQNLFAGIGTGGETWSGTMTQYCDGPTVPQNATFCPSGAPVVGYPGSGALAGVWFDTAAPSPTNATAAQLAAEAVAAAAHFGNTTAASNRYSQYVIVSPSGTHPDGFPSGFCAWHNYTSSAYGDIAYTNMPYVTDAGANCGENFVNSGSLGTLDGFSIVNGHEYAETLTDQNPPGGWTNLMSGEEDADECAWISSGQGAAANVSMGNGAYAMQSTWSNDTDECDISHTILSSGGGGGGLSAPMLTSSYYLVASGTPYTLSWTVPAASINHYTLDETSLRTGNTTPYVVPAPTTSKTFTKITGSEKDFSYEVRACSSADESACSAWSNQVDVTICAIGGCP